MLRSHASEGCRAKAFVGRRRAPAREPHLGEPGARYSKPGPAHEALSFVIGRSFPGKLDAGFVAGWSLCFALFRSI